MAVAAAFGGVSPNFFSLYNEVTRLSKTLSIASPREINNPGETLKLTVRNPSLANSQPQTFDVYMKPYYAKEGDPVAYELYYKDGNNDEKAITQVRYSATKPPRLLNQAVLLTNTTTDEYSINGQVIDINNQLVVDVQSGRIKYRGGTGFDANTDDYVAGNTNNIEIGVVKFEGATGLDVGLINDRISQINLTIEGLNKVLLVAASNIDKALSELR